MNTNMAKLRGKIVERNTTQEAVADAIGVNRTTFYRKIKSDGASFTIGEVHKIVKAIGLSTEEACEIFLGQ